MKSKLTTAIFLNHCFDKRRFQSFLYWFFKKSHSGQSRLLNFLEKLKFLGFHSATQAGFSISIDDLKIPSPKSAILSAAENIVFNADLHLISGHLTTIERYQRIIEIWNRTSEKLKYQVLQSFQISDFLNPVYLMAFSGARGNISQIRQLVGMRGLMADPQGKIIDFPIRSNFREGLTLTEYLISCSGARKGIVDTALRTAASGYLTRRLVDVAHHVIISQIDCQQVFEPNGQGALTQACVPRDEKPFSKTLESKTSQYGIWIEALYDQQKEILPLQQRLVGRILAETIVHGVHPIGLKDQEITQITSQKICKYRKKVLIRSPLTCQSSKFICQLCYGWNLSEGQLVSVGEAVGVLAAQSIGEPGTQLTMRTFHTGGVFTGRLIDQTYAPFFGTAHYNSFCNGLLIRTVQGRIAYLSKNGGILSIYPSKKRTPTSPSRWHRGQRSLRGAMASLCDTIEQRSRVQSSSIIAPFLYAARYRQYLASLCPVVRRTSKGIRCSYFMLEKLRLRFAVRTFNFSQFKVKFELKPIYSNFLLDSMSDFKVKNKHYFQKIKTGLVLSLVSQNPLLYKSRPQVFAYNQNAITDIAKRWEEISPRTLRTPVGSNYPIFLHSQSFVYQFKKLSCQLKGMISLNQTWLNLWVAQDGFRSPERNALADKSKASLTFSANTKNQKYKFTNTCRFNLNFIFNISQIDQKKLQIRMSPPRAAMQQAAQKIGWSAWRHRFRDTKDQAQYSFEKRIQFVFQIFTLLYVRQGENVLKTQLIAELPFFENEKSLENEQEILSNESGEIYFENFVFLEKTRSDLKTGFEITKIIKDYVQGLGEFWILFGRSFQHLLTTKKLSFLHKFDLIDSSIPFVQIQIEPHNFLNIASPGGISDDLVLQNNFIQLEQVNLFSRRKKISLCLRPHGQKTTKIQNLQYHRFSRTHLIFKPGLWSCPVLCMTIIQSAICDEPSSSSCTPQNTARDAVHPPSGFCAFKPINASHQARSKIKTQLPHPSANTILQKFSRTFQIDCIFFKNFGYLQIPSSNALSKANGFAFNKIGFSTFVCCVLGSLRAIRSMGDPERDRISKKINSSFLNQNFNPILTQSKIMYREFYERYFNGTYSSPTGLNPRREETGNARWLNEIPSFNLANCIPWDTPRVFVSRNAKQELGALLPRQRDPWELNKNFVIFWTDRKNYQKRLNKSFATWMIGLQRQSKYIPKYSDFRQQFFKISRKHFYLQFLKNCQSNFHPMSFLNLQKQKRNFFFKDTSFRMQKNSQKFFCEFHNQRAILSRLDRTTTHFCLSSQETKASWTQGEKQIDFPESDFKKYRTRYQLPFFFHENTCLLFVNRQGISQFFGREIIPNSATPQYDFRSSPQPGSLREVVPPGSDALRAACAPTGFPPGGNRLPTGSDEARQVKSMSSIRLTSKINFHSLLLNLQVFGFCKVSFRMGTKKCWKIPKISENQLPKFWLQTPKGQCVNGAKKKLNIYHWLSNQQSRHCFVFWTMLQFFKRSLSPLLCIALRCQNIEETQSQNQLRENIQSVFCTLFLKQSKLFQNLPKNWKRQITNPQPKIIHWNDLPYQKYIFLISFLKELQRSQKLPVGTRFPGAYHDANWQCNRKILPFQKFTDFRIVFRSSQKFYLKNLDWKVQFWQIQQRQNRIGYLKWKMGFYSFIRIFFCILTPRSADQSIHQVQRLYKRGDGTSAARCQTSKFSLIFETGGKYRIHPKSPPSCFKNLWPQRCPICYSLALDDVNRYQHRGHPYQYSLLRQDMSQKFLFNKEKLSTLAARSVNPKNWTLFSNFFIPKQTNENWIANHWRSPSICNTDKMLSPRAHHFVIRPTEIKPGNTESKTRKEMILHRSEKFASQSAAKRGFSIYTGLWTSKFIDFSDFRSSFPGDEKLKNNFQNIQFGFGNEIFERSDSNFGNQFAISDQWKFFGDCVTILEQQLYPTYFQNFSLIENYLNVKRDGFSNRVFQKPIKDLQISIASAIDFKTQIQHCGTFYPSLDKVLSRTRYPTTTTNWRNEISGKKTAVFLLNKILPKSLFYLESGIFKNRILPFYTQIESSKLQKYILDFYFGSYCHILKNFSLFKNFTSRFSQNQPKKPIYNMFSVTRRVDETQFISKYNFENKVQKTDIAAKDPTLSEIEAKMDETLEAKDKSASSNRFFNQHRSGKLPVGHRSPEGQPPGGNPVGAMPTNQRRSRMEQFDACLKTKFHNSDRSTKLNQSYPYPGDRKSVIYQIRTGSNNQNELNQIYNNILRSKDGMTQSIAKNTINLQKSDIQHFFEYETSTKCEFHNFYIEYISKKSSRFKDDFSQIRNFHKLNMKSWLNRKKNFQKYSVRYLKSKFISKKLNLFIKTFDPTKADETLHFRSEERKLCYLKFSRENWDNFYSIYLNYPSFSLRMDTKCQNRKFFRIPFILNPKQRTDNQKNITLNNFFAPKLGYSSKITHPFVMRRKLHFKILSIIQTLLFVYHYYRNYNIPLSRSDQNISRLALRSRILLRGVQGLHPGNIKLKGKLNKNRGFSINPFPSYSRAILKKEYFNGRAESIAKFISHLSIASRCVYIPLLDQSYEIFLTSIIPLNLNFSAFRSEERKHSDKEMHYKTSISNAIPKILDQTHFLKIHIIQTKRFGYRTRYPFQYWLNPQNKDVCHYQIIKKNDLKSFEIQIFIRLFFPFPLGEIVDLSQKTKSLLFTNIEDFFSYHNHRPSAWTDLNVQNYKPPVFLDDFFNLFYFQSKNKTKKNFAHTFTLTNTPICVSICNPVSKFGIAKAITTIIARFRSRYKKVGLGFDFNGLYRDRWLKVGGVQKYKLPKISNPKLDPPKTGRGSSDMGKLKQKSKINLSLYREAQTLLTLGRVELDLQIQLFQKPNNRFLNKQCFQTSLADGWPSSESEKIVYTLLAAKRSNEVLSTPILIHKRPSFQKNIVILSRNKKAIAKGDQVESSRLGSFMRGGQELNAHQFSFHAGQLIAKTRHIFLYRKATTHLLNNQNILHVQHGEIILKNQRLYSVFYSQSKTGDIVQGIPKIEEIFEARKKSKYSLHELPIFSKDFLFFEKKITKYLQSLQKSVVNSIQRIYCGQGIHISDKHIEIIVRQMTSNVIILEPGQTGLLCGEIVALHWVRRTNSLFTSNQVIYEPIFLGMTKTCLETSSFLSAASFQETTRILSRAALQNQIDFIRGLKQNVILGNLLPIGTGYFK